MLQSSVTGCSFNPAHADIKTPILLEIECSEIINTDGTKHACKEQTPIGVLQLPEVTTTQRIAFAIKCALLDDKDDKFILWANKWLSGEDRSRESAYAINAYASTIAHTTAYTNNCIHANTTYTRAYVTACAVAYNADDHRVALYVARAACAVARYTKGINTFFIETIEFVVANY